MFVAVVAILLLAQSPASAHHRDGHDNGPSEEATQEDSETTSEESDSEAGSEDSDDATADDGANDDGSGGGWSSFRQRASHDREQQETSTTTTTSTTTPFTPGGQGCDGSHHSDSGDGANRSGPDNPYQNTCDGRQPGNGQGNARPCAGCVGNADDKFPPGQEPDGTDHNNGYECDGNEGIAKENPAHTGCVLPPPEVCDANPATPMIEPCVLGNPPETPPRRPPPPPGPPRRDLVLPRPPIRFNPPDVVRNVPPGILPVTGGTPFGFLVLGLGMIATGAATLSHRRVRRGARRKI